MGRSIASRVAQALVVVALVVTACFIVIRLAPGDPFAQQVAVEGIGADERERLRVAFGYDKPLPEQYLRFVANAARGDFGWSHLRGAPVRSVLGRALPATLLLVGSALLVGILIGVPLGAWQAWRHESRAARWSDSVGLLVLSVPEFVLALLLVLGPALAWELFPINGAASLVPPAGWAARVLDRLHHLALPCLSLALIIAAVIARHQRAALLEIRDAPFLRAARARGVPDRRLLWHHALPAALAPSITIIGVMLPALVGGSVLVERVFAWPGMGLALVDAVLARDYHLVVGAVLTGSTGVVAAGLLADIAVHAVDPRQRSL